MSRSEFRYNKRRKHYSYQFKDRGDFRENIILTSKPTRKFHERIKKNIKLHKHPNPNSSKDVYVIPKVYVDDIKPFDSKVLHWNWDKNDKRKIKRIKKRKKV